MISGASGRPHLLLRVDGAGTRSGNWPVAGDGTPPARGNVDARPPLDATPLLVGVGFLAFSIAWVKLWGRMTGNLTTMKPVCHDFSLFGDPRKNFCKRCAISQHEVGEMNRPKIHNCTPKMIDCGCQECVRDLKELGL